MISRSPRECATVLVVEDDFLVRIVAAEVLHERGLRVLQANNGPDALQLLEASPHVDVVFTDVNMPGEFDGLGLARRVRDGWPHIAIVIASGRACPQAQLLPARFVPKPYQPDAVARIIGELIGRQGEHRAASDLNPVAV
jgi:two-component system, response regulator PdtaR